MIYIIYIIAGILMVLGIISWHFSKIAMYPRTFDYDKTYDIETEAGNINKEEFEALSKEEVFIPSRYGYKLHGIWFPNEAAKKTVVFAHGITYTLFGSIKYMNVFYKRGFNVLVYDHRFHGKSGGDNCTFGYYEKNDLKSCIDWVLNRVGKDSIVGTHGESMGAATVLQHAAIDKRLAFVIADCPYKSAVSEFKYRLKIEYKLPSFPVINISSLINKLKTGVFYSEASPISTIKNIDAPILFIHGDGDTYIPHSHSVDMYNLKAEPKMLYLAKGAGHARSITTDKEKYEEVVEEFLNKIEV